MTMRKTTILLALLGLATAAAAQQGKGPRLLTDRFAQLGMQFSSWSVNEDRLTQMALPVSYRMPMGEEGQLYVSTSPAFSGLKRDSLDYSLSGLTDVRIGGNRFLFNHNWLLTFGVNLPTGKSALDPLEEVKVWRELVQPAFHFPVAVYGQGLDVNLGLSTAYELGDWMLGAGIAYLYKGAFKPIDGASLEYDAGDEIIFTVGAQRENLMADLMVTYYGVDQLGGVDRFQSGLTFLIQLAGRWELGCWQVDVLARDQYKTKNKISAGTGLITERTTLNGNQFEFHALGRRPMQNHLDLQAAWDLRVYANNGFGWGGSMFTGPGVGVKWRLTDSVSLDLMTLMLFGKINTLAGSFDASGLTGRAGLAVQL